MSDLKEVYRHVASGEALLVDVRSSAEYKAGSAEHAINLDLADIMEGAVPTEELDKPIYLFCRSGNRSGMAAHILTSKGYTNAYNVGGLHDWQAIVQDLNR